MCLIWVVVSDLLVKSVGSAGFGDVGGIPMTGRGKADRSRFHKDVEVLITGGEMFGADLSLQPRACENFMTYAAGEYLEAVFGVL